MGPTVLHSARGWPIGIIDMPNDATADGPRYGRIRVVAPYETPLPDWPLEDEPAPSLDRPEADR